MLIPLIQLTLIEHGNDLAGEAPDRLLIIGLAWDRDDEVVDPRVDHRLEPLSYRLWRPHYGLPGIFVIWPITAGLRRLLLGVRFILDEVDLCASGLDDLLVVSPHILAVALEDIELVADRLDVAHDVAGVTPLGYQLERHSLASAPDPERRMRLLDTFGLVDGRVNRIVLAFKLGVILRPHAVDDLARLAEHPHPVAKLGEAIAISPPLVLVPACSDASIQPAVAGDVHRGGDLGIQRRVTVAVAAYHLPDLDVLCVACEGGCDRPAREAGLKLWRGDSMEVVEDPDRIPPSLIGHACDPRHGLVLFDGIVDLRQVHAPPLRYEDSESDWHHLPPFYLTSSARAHVESLPISHEGAWWSRPAPPRRDLYLHTRRLCRHRSLPLVVWQSLSTGIAPRGYPSMPCSRRSTS